MSVKGTDLIDNANAFKVDERGEKTVPSEVKRSGTKYRWEFMSKIVEHLALRDRNKEIG